MSLHRYQIVWEAIYYRPADSPTLRPNHRGEKAPSFATGMNPEICFSTFVEAFSAEDAITQLRQRETQLYQSYKENFLVLLIQPAIHQP
jgi:hypothetical protein